MFWLIFTLMFFYLNYLFSLCVSAPLCFLDYINVLRNMLYDESSVTVKHVCAVIKCCVGALSWSTYDVYAYDLVWSILDHVDNSYWLVKVPVVFYWWCVKAYCWIFEFQAPCIDHGAEIYLNIKLLKEICQKYDMPMF